MICCSGGVCSAEKETGKKCDDCRNAESPGGAPVMRGSSFGWGDDSAKRRKKRPSAGFLMKPKALPPGIVGSKEAKPDAGFLGGTVRPSAAQIAVPTIALNVVPKDVRPAAVDTTAPNTTTNTDTTVPGKIQPQQSPSGGQIALGITGELLNFGQHVVDAYFSNQYQNARLEVERARNRPLTQEEQVQLARYVADQNAQGNDLNKGTTPSPAPPPVVTGEKSALENPVVLAIGAVAIAGAVTAVVLLTRKKRRGRGSR